MFNRTVVRKKPFCLAFIIDVLGVVTIDVCDIDDRASMLSVFTFAVNF